MRVLVDSDSLPGVHYIVDLAAGTCTCPHFERIKPKECKHFGVARLALPDPVADIPTLDEVMQEADPHVEEALAVLAHPDPEELPELPPALVPMLVEQTACHLVRALLREEARLEIDEQRMQEDIAAWQAYLAKRQERAKAARQILLDWMQRAGVTKLQHPRFTCSVAKGRKRLEVKDEAATIARCEEVYAAAVAVKKSLRLRELQVAVDSLPGLFAGLVEETVGEPSLRIVQR